MPAALVRLAPGAGFYLGVVFSLILATVALGLAVEQRWLGLTLSGTSGGAGVQLDIGEGPSAGIPAGGRILAITGLDGERIELAASDLIAEPDGLGSFAQMRAFFERQTAIAAMLRQPRVEAEVLLPSGDVTVHRLNPEGQRPIPALPFGFWLQIGVGLAGFWIGTWVWTLRPKEWSTRHLAFAGLGLMMSTFPAAIYSTRELAIDGGLFAVLSGMNAAGALIFGVGMIGLFLAYPKKLVPTGWMAVPAIMLGGWLFVDLTALVEGPAMGRHFAIVCVMAAIVVLVLVQGWLARRSPVDRAALAWLGLAVVLGAGLFVATTIVPAMLGLEAVLAQEQAFLFFLLTFAGIALGVARYRLFELDEWAFGVFFYLFGVLLLIALDAVLIFTIVDERAPAFALSLLVVVLVWLPLRDRIERRLLGRRRIETENLFRQVMDVVLAPPDASPGERWRGLLHGAFKPLRAVEVPDVAQPALRDNGMVMELPGAGRLPAMRLEYADGGRKLFSSRDLELAAELAAMLRNAEESRIAYERGVLQERERIAKDIHDNIGVQLMGALHSPDVVRKDTLVRETLADLREIINNASHPDLSLEEVLADLRSQISEHLHTAGMQLDWSVRHEASAMPSPQVVNALRAFLREAVQNVLKHSGATRVSITVGHDQAGIGIEIVDDGIGFDPATVPAGNGLANMRSRVEALGGTFHLVTGGSTTRIRAAIPEVSLVSVS